MKHVVDEDLAVADMAGIQDAACRFDNLLYRNLRDNDFHFYLGEKGGVDHGAPVSFRGASLNAAAHDLGHGHAGHTDLIEAPLELVKFVEPADDGKTIHARVREHAGCPAATPGAVLFDVSPWTLTAARICSGVAFS